MKTWSSVCFGTCLAVLAAPSVPAAGIINGSFESWDLLGWSAQIPEGSMAETSFARPVGTARTMANWGESLGLGPVVQPASGYRFLALESRDNANLIGTGSYDFSVSQSFSLSAGVSLSGSALFITTDIQPLDSAWVRILNAEGAVIAQPWGNTSGVAAAAAFGTTVPEWSKWYWTAPSTATYTLQLGMTTKDQDNDASYGFFDHVFIGPEPVPEPTLTALGLAGVMAGLAMRRRCRN